MATAVESSSGPPACLGCGEPMSGKYVNALDGYWHMACFKCADCGDLVASKFYEFLGKPLCERDHYRRRDLICAQCDQPIKGRSLTALERVFHPEHFVCATCKVSLINAEAQQLTFYEEKDEPYCRLHYSLKFAAPCIGCKMAILRQFVDDGENHWHVDCYKIFQLWGVILPASLEGIPVDDLSQSEQARLQLEDLQEQTDTRIASVLSVLWAYEEAVAYSIAETLIGFETHEYTQAPDRALAIVSCAEVMISSMEALGLPPSAADDDWQQFIQSMDKSLSFVAQSYRSMGSTSKKGNLKVLVDHATDVARSFKNVIRKSVEVVVTHPNNRVLVDQLVVLLREAYQGAGGPDTPMSAPDPNMSSTELSAEGDGLKGPSTIVFENVVQRLETSIPESEDQSATPAALAAAAAAAATGLHGTFAVARTSTTQCKHIVTLKNLVENKLGFLRNAVLPLLDLSTPNSRSSTAATTPLQTTPPKIPFNLNYDSDDDDWESKMLTERKKNSASPAGKHVATTELAQPKENNPPAARHPLPAGIATGMAPSTFSREFVEHSTLLLHAPKQSSIRDAPLRVHHEHKEQFVNDLSAIDLMIVRQMAVLRLSALFGSDYPIGELVKLTQPQEHKTLLRRVVHGFKISKKKKEVNVFGMPLQGAVTRAGVDSALGLSAGKMRIPVLVEKSIKYLDDYGIGVEGIFKKGGNTKRVLNLKDQFAKAVDGSLVNTSDASPIDIAALLKRFFVELNDPLFTFALYDAFILSQTKSQNKQIRNEIIHLLVLLLPKAHRDVLEVFASFLKRVAQHARLFVVGREASTDAMTEENLAMTLAPYLLYPRSAQQQKLDQLEQSSSSSITGSLLTSTEAEQHAVAVVTSVIKHVAVFSKVPQDISQSMVKPKSLLGLTK